MKREFVVLDHEGQVSMKMKGNDAVVEKFRSFVTADKRAKELAGLEPGATIRTYELTAETIAPVQPVVTSRRHPREHYK